MNLIKYLSVVFGLLLAAQVAAYDSKDEMIDDKLAVLANGSTAEKIRMLERLQWSALTDQRLFDNPNLEIQ